jgi:hypothetical protein
MSQYNSYFTESYFCFENKPMDNQLIPVPSSSPTYFGMLYLNTIPSHMTEYPQEFVFVVDRSGSMSQLCSDNKSKMHHLIHTLKKMVLFFLSTPSVEIYMSIFAFDDSFDTLVERTQITQDTVDAIVTKIEELSPQSSTNIENALTHVRDYISLLKKEHPTHTIHHLFLTDGQVTSGSNDHNVLRSLMDRSIYHFVIGFGIHHDAYLLHYISNFNNSSYHFVDEYDKIGLVYGEILHNILYVSLKKVCISILNGFVYDYKMNTWVNTLHIGDLVGESNKTFHIASSYPEYCHILLDFTTLQQNEEAVCLEIGKWINPSIDLTQYVYRQRTLQLLFVVYTFQLQKKIFKRECRSFLLENTEYDDKLSYFQREEKQIKTELVHLLQEMQSYLSKLSQENHDEKKWIKHLCDDLYISYSTFDKKYAFMYGYARQTSQGSQRSYTVSSTPDEEILHSRENMSLDEFVALKKPPLNRLNTHHLHNVPLSMSHDTEPATPSSPFPFLQYTLSDFREAPYGISSNATHVMRSISELDI